MVKILIFGQNFNFLSKFRFSAKFRCLGKVSINRQNCDFWPKFWFLVKTSIFGQNCHFWSKLRSLAKISFGNLYFYLGYFFFRSGPTQVLARYSNMRHVSKQSSNFRSSYRTSNFSRENSRIHRNHSSATTYSLPESFSSRYSAFSREDKRRTEFKIYFLQKLAVAIFDKNSIFLVKNFYL